MLRAVQGSLPDTLDCGFVVSYVADEDGSEHQVTLISALVVRFGLQVTTAVSLL